MWVRVDISITFRVLLDVVHVMEVADRCSVFEPVSEGSLCNDLAEGLKANVEQQAVSLVYAELGPLALKWLPE